MPLDLRLVLSQRRNIIFTNLTPETSHRQRSFQGCAPLLAAIHGPSWFLLEEPVEKRREERRKRRRSGIPGFERTLSRGLGLGLGLVYSPSVLSVALLFAGAAPYSTGTVKGAIPQG